MLVPVRCVKRPFSGWARVGRGFEPALRRDDIVPAVSVEITGTDTVAVALRTHDMLDPLASSQFEPSEGNFGPVEFGKKLKRLSVVIQIDQKRELRWSARVDLGGLPIASRLAGVLQPNDI